MVNAVEVVYGIYNISTLGHSSNLREEYIHQLFINLDNISVSCTATMVVLMVVPLAAPTFFIASKSSASR